MKKEFLLLSALVLSAGVYAGDPVSSPNADDDSKGKFTFSGYIDSYYIANLNKPASRSNLGAAGTARVFDQRSGQFSLGLIQTKIGYSTAKSDVVVDLTFGPNADLGNYGNLIGPLGPGGSSIAIKQAYFNWKATDKLTFTVGQFGTHIGYEVIDAPVNYNYSLSNLFNNGPFYHVGAKATYAFSDKSSLMLGVVNNVDALNDNNRKKGLIGQFFVSPASGWNIYLNGIYSNEATPDSLGVTPEASYGVVDLATTYQITEKFFVGLNAAMGSQKGDYQGYTFADGKKSWGGVALYSNYALTSNFGIGARYEYFDNTAGVRGLRNRLGDGTSVNSITFTGNITVADGHLLIKPEVRVDSYAKPASSAEGNLQFEDSKGNFTKSSQTTVGMAFIYKF
ncbi:outer membrane beta-barrel protein [Rudanella paleaurantiibacter]|uniref:Outer membrane beta-barrel protein n=1 Tax=Rudanella paleaurantiibacter TaxID=2614655 RepID=A0A7J5TVZ1_9BACT|nr:porin [Rudanella paleaurantiibacter]KAB7728103.1 outer membrane beta-barrel protein [Rudanella paleaurantiibacter]